MIHGIKNMNVKFYIRYNFTCDSYLNMCPVTGREF